jgi:hypothetical protein
LMSTPIKTMSSPKITPLNVHFIVPNMSFHPYYIHPGFIWGFFMNVGRDYKKLLRALFHIYININIYIPYKNDSRILRCLVSSSWVVVLSRSIPIMYSYSLKSHMV